MRLTAEQLIERIQKALDDTKADIAHHETELNNQLKLLSHAFASNNQPAETIHRELANSSRTAINEAVRAAARLSRILVDAGVTKGGGE